MELVSDDTDVVRGDERAVRDFPTTADLPLQTRSVIGATKLFDVALRTAGASLVTASMAPALFRPGQMARTLRNSEHYLELAAARDASRTFTRPTTLPDVELVKREPARWRWLPGIVDLLRFPSTYVPANPSVRVQYGRVARNSTAWAQHWQHDDGPRPTVVVVHGFMASPYWFNKLFFSLPWWYANGYDLLLVTLPFHGRRARRWQLDGSGLFGGGPTRMIEGMLHAVHDLRSWIDHLEAKGVTQIGMTGLSLGGYLTSVMAAVDDRLHFAIPNAPVTDFDDLVELWHPAGAVVQAAMRLHGMERSTLRELLQLHSPLRYDPVLERDRLFVIAGLGDRLAPPDHAERLWEHWDRPMIHAFPGNHVLHLERRHYLSRIGRFIRSTGFGSPS